MLAAGRGCWCRCGRVQLHMVHQLEAAGLIGAAAGALLDHAVVHTEAAALQIPHVAAHGGGSWFVGARAGAGAATACPVSRILVQAGGPLGKEAPHQKGCWKQGEVPGQGTPAPRTCTHQQQNAAGRMCGGSASLPARQQPQGCMQHSNQAGAAALPAHCLSAMDTEEKARLSQGMSSGRNRAASSDSGSHAAKVKGGARRARNSR